VLPQALLERWEDADWPGNLRELRNAVIRWVALGEYEALHTDKRRPVPDQGDVESIDQGLDRILALGLPFGEARQKIVSLFERRYVENVLAAHGGNVSRAAAASGIGRRYFYMLLAKRDAPL